MRVRIHLEEYTMAKYTYRLDAVIEVEADSAKEAWEEFANIQSGYGFGPIKKYLGKGFERIDRGTQESERVDWIDSQEK
jgi:hypothetical protein